MFGLTSGSNSGVAMIAKSMGIDADSIMQKANDFERFAKSFMGATYNKVAEIDAKLKSQDEKLDKLSSDMDTLKILLASAIEKSARMGGPVTPAGDSWECAGIDQQEVS